MPDGTPKSGLTKGRIAMDGLFLEEEDDALLEDAAEENGWRFG